MKRKLSLSIGAIAFFLTAIAHLAFLADLPQVFGFFGVAELYTLLSGIGAWAPYAATLLLALGFALAGLYGLSAAGYLRLPFTRLAIVMILAVFVLRLVYGGVLLLTQGFDMTEICNMAVVALIVLCYMPAVIRR
ncbi:MAG: hypothetical protein ACI30W_04725 [Muribaculaceae bacterium]